MLWQCCDQQILCDWLQRQQQQQLQQLRQLQQPWRSVSAAWLASQASSFCKHSFPGSSSCQLSDISLGKPHVTQIGCTSSGG
jgi:hypothetical protein